MFSKIENVHPFEFKDGIDTESPAYIYQNAFNQFRYENEHIINMNVAMLQKQSALNEGMFHQMMKKCNIPLLKQQFPDNFTFVGVFGKGG